MLFIKGVPEFPQTTQAIPNALGCPPQLNGKTLLQKTTHSGCKTQYSIWNSQPTPCWLAFPLPEVLCRLLKDKGHQHSYPVLASAHCSTDLPGKIDPWETMARCFQGQPNPFWSDLILLFLRERICGMVNPDRSPRLGRASALGVVLCPFLSWDSIPLCDHGWSETTVEQAGWELKRPTCLWD